MDDLQRTTGIDEVTDFSTNDFSVEVTMSGDQLDPDRLTSILSLEPTRTGIAGQPRQDPDGRTGPVCDTAIWSHEVSSREDVNECRDHQINCLLDAIVPNIDAVQDAGVEKIYFYHTLASSIGLLNIRLRPETMAKLASIDADLYISCFDCFNPSDKFWKAEQGSASSV